MPIESSVFLKNETIDSDGSTGMTGAVHTIQRALGHTPIVLLTGLIFLVFLGAGIAICLVVEGAKESELQEEALGLAIETGNRFSDQLDQAILPLFSIAQFATHLGILRDLPDRIGVAGEAGSLPMINGSSHRNLTGVCDQPELVSTFIEIASGIKKYAKMDGILVNIQLAPQGVICLLRPMNNTEDFEDGNFLDSTSAWGLDLFNDPFYTFIAAKSIKDEKVGIAGPRKLTQCPTCDPFVIARLPIVYDSHEIVVDGVSYPRWGFATALIAWTQLVEQSGICESFESSGFQFQLTRTDTTVNPETEELEEKVVILAETRHYHLHSNHHFRAVSTTLETTNNQWMMTVVYDHRPFISGH
jgi:hypothetical protein